jgi:hypothetical protein
MEPDGSYRQLFPASTDGPGAEGTHATLMRLARARHGL